MIAKVTGYKIIDKNDKRLCIISYLRDFRQGTSEVGLIAENNFLPPYLVEHVGTYIGQYCVISFHKYNDKYSISNVEVISSDNLNTD